MADNFSESVDQNREQSIDLRDYWMIIIKRKWTILTFFVILVTSVAVGSIRQPKIYQATSSIIIDTAAPEILSGIREVVNMGNGGYWTNKEFFETQYKILHSRALAQKVSAQLDLAHNMTFLELDKVTDAVEREKLLASADPETVLLDKLTITPVKDSRIVLLNVRDQNPQFAALLANTVADAYIEMNLDTKLDATRTATNWLSEQLRDLKDKMEKSELALYTFKKDNNILSVSLEDHQNMTAQKLRALNETLSKTEATRIELESKRRQIFDIKNGKQELDSLEPILGSPIVQHLKEQYFKSKSEYNELSSKYGDKHPKLQLAKSQLDLAKNNIDREINMILSGLDAQYAMLLDTEKSLKEALEETKAIALDINKKEIDYNKLKRESDNNASLYGLVLKRLKETDLTGMLKNNNVRRLDSALVPKVPVKPRVKFNILIAMLIGFVGGLGLAFFFEFLDNTIKTQEDIERVLGLTFLGFIPTIVVDEASSENDERMMKDLYLFSHPKSNAAEACRSIRTNIMFVTPDKPVRTLLFTSAGPQEGKSITATSVAISMALSGNKTILVDADMRKPRIHRSFGLENELGLSSCIIGGSELEPAIQHTTVPNLDVMPCGPIPPNPAELLHTDRFKELLAALMNKYDKVIFDSPPVIAVTDAVIMSRMMDCVILVIKSAKTSRDMAKATVKQLSDVNARIIGAVLNDLDFEDRGYRYYYYYYYRRYGYYYGEKGEKVKRRSSHKA